MSYSNDFKTNFAKKKLMLSLAIAHAQALTITCTNRRVNSIINWRTRCIIFLFCSVLFVGTNYVSALAPSDVTV